MTNTAVPNERSNGTRPSKASLTGEPFPRCRAPSLPWIVLYSLTFALATVACKPSAEQQHRAVLASIDLSTVAGAAKSLCVALNDGSADVVSAVLDGDYWQRASKTCVGAACLALVQQYKSCPDNPTWKDFPRCAPAAREKDFAKFVGGVRQRGYHCKQVKVEDNNAVILEVVPGVQDKVTFEQGPRGFRPDPGNTLLDSRMALAKMDLTDSLNKKPAETTK